MIVDAIRIGIAEASLIEHRRQRDANVLPLQAREAYLSRSYSINKRAQHVLTNLDRVIAKPYVLEVRSPQRRSQLDGVECTPQITSLVVQGHVHEDANGKLTRTSLGILTQQKLLVAAD